MGGLCSPHAENYLAFTAESVAVRDLTVDVIDTPKLTRGYPQWQLFSLDTFDEGEHQWTPKKTQACGNSLNKFLGGHCALGGTENAYRHYRGLPPHNRVRVTALVHFFDEWKGETVYLSADNTVRWSLAYNWCDSFFSVECKNKALDFCGRMFPDKLSHLLTVSFNHTTPELRLQFGSTLGKRSACDVSFGIDDVSVELKTE